MEGIAAGVVDHREQIAAHTVHVRLDEPQHGVGGDGRVDGMAAAREHLRPRLCGQRRAGGHDAACRGDERTTGDDRHAGRHCRRRSSGAE
jgi:hypothetical protein